MTATTTDKRIDDLRSEMHHRFDNVDQRFDQVDRRFAQVDHRFDRVEGDIRELRVGQEALRAEIKAGDEGLRAEMKAGDEGLRAEIKAGDDALRLEMREGFTALNQSIEGLRKILLYFLGGIVGSAIAGIIVAIVATVV